MDFWRLSSVMKLSGGKGGGEYKPPVTATGAAADRKLETIILWATIQQVQKKMSASFFGSSQSQSLLFLL